MDIVYGMHSMGSKKHIGVELANERELIRPEQMWFDVIDQTIRGFGQFSIKSKIKFSHDTRRGRRPLDFESFRSFWMLSDACKIFFEDHYPGTMEFRPGEITLDNSNTGHIVWLADVVNVVDALDEQLSDIKIMHNGRKSYFLSGSRNIVFYKHVIVYNPIFRMKYAEYKVICRSDVRDEFRRAGLKGAAFIKNGHSV